MEKLPAHDHEYADVINRIVTEFDDTPDGAPPGVVVEGIITAQETPSAMSTGTGDWPANDIGWHFRTDSEEMQWFMERRNGATPATVEEWAWLVANGVDTRQEMGGYFTDWHAAALGTTGYVRHDGVNPDMSDADKDKAGQWFRTYAGSMQGRTAREVDELQPGSAVIGTDDAHVTVEPGGSINENPVYGDKSIWETERDNLTSAVNNALISPMRDAISQYAGEWGPRILLFLIGIVVLGVGVWFTVKGKK